MSNFTEIKVLCQVTGIAVFIFTCCMEAYNSKDVEALGLKVGVDAYAVIRAANVIVEIDE